MSAIVTLTTDFGQVDGYVAAMKGAILAINPGAKLVDCCHNIEPQNITQAAFVLSTFHEYFPPGTIHLVVVDPGVGTERRAIILKTPGAYFVAPDNGVLSYIVRSDALTTSQQVKLPPGFEATAITNPRFWRSPVSPTFHGRDIFAPVAAHLSLGIPPASFGDRIDELVILPIARPYFKGEGTLIGHIAHVDRFGNLITNIKSNDLPVSKRPIKIEIKGNLITGLAHTYAEGQGLMALIGSSGYLEIALKNGSAASLLNLRAGDEVKLVSGGT